VLEEVRGDIFAAEVDALVNAVNTAGVMGKGVALAFKKRFPDNFLAYRTACRRGEVRVGEVFVVARETPPRFIFNFPTKEHWSGPSRLEYVRGGLVELKAKLAALAIGSLALPALGCGAGGLRWEEVRPLIIDSLGGLAGMRVLLFAPR
jgi:O-acetyl-ADP-ribose deacetylase (regulator of RNase III)